jgi:hypothetical protein
MRKIDCPLPVPKDGSGNESSTRFRPMLRAYSQYAKPPEKAPTEKAQNKPMAGRIPG